MVTISLVCVQLLKCELLGGQCQCCVHGCQHQHSDWHSRHTGDIWWLILTDVLGDKWSTVGSTGASLSANYSTFQLQTGHLSSLSLCLLICEDLPDKIPEEASVSIRLEHLAQELMPGMGSGCDHCQPLFPLSIIACQVATLICLSFNELKIWNSPEQTIFASKC